jgi:phosphoribosyl-AMP cyclohydrolase / phosphoribosyl-ATP pyrophosphohydrolase
MTTPNDSSATATSGHTDSSVLEASLIRQAKYDSAGLVACIVQSTHGDVRMLGYMNAEALALTLQTRRVTFFSRSRQTLWVKGETSGHVLRLRSLSIDCDGDALLAIADCEGPTCHRGTRSCFGKPAGTGIEFLSELEALLATKKATARVDGSYTEKLFAAGTDRIAKKVVEEAGEVILAAKNLERAAEGPTNEATLAHERAEFVGEVADLVFHATMLLVQHGIPLHDVASILESRHATRTSGDG